MLVTALAENLGPRWLAGAETIVDTLVDHGLARTDGDGDQETVTFTTLPLPAHV